MPRPSHRRSVPRAVLFRTGAVLAGIVLAILLAETGLRVAGVHPPRIRSKRYLEGARDDYHLYPTNPNGEFSPLPNLAGAHWRLFTETIPPRELPLSRATETPWCVKYEFSPLGLRDRAYPRRVPPGKVRVAGVGDSFARGEGVPMEKTLFRQMEALAGEQVEIVNMGDSGSRLSFELALLRRLGPELRCTRALFVFVPDDIELSEEMLERHQWINDLINLRAEELEAHERDAWYKGHLRILELLGSAIERRRIARDTVQWYLDCWKPEHNREQIEEFRQQLRELAVMPEYETAYVLYPLLLGFPGEYPLAEIHEKVAGWAREAGLPVLDLAPAFADENAEDLHVHPTDHHPNGRAHAIAARAIVDWLEREHPAFLAPD